MNVIKDKYFEGRILDLTEKTIAFVRSQIKMFDDHLTVESSGTLSGIVRLNNMREIHFSRNPKIAGFLHEYEYVREFGEGIDRMYLEMQQAGLPETEYRTEAFMVYATIRNKNSQSTGLATSQGTRRTQVEQQDELQVEVPKRILENI